MNIRTRVRTNVCAYTCSECGRTFLWGLFSAHINVENEIVSEWRFVLAQLFSLGFASWCKNNAGQMNLHQNTLEFVSEVLKSYCILIKDYIDIETVLFLFRITCTDKICPRLGAFIYKVNRNCVHFEITFLMSLYCHASESGTSPLSMPVWESHVAHVLKANLAPPGSTLCSNVIGVLRPWRRFHIRWSLELDQLRSQRAAMTRDARAVN